MTAKLEELPAAAPLGDNMANPTTAMVGAGGLLWNPTAGQWMRAAGGVLNVALASGQAQASATHMQGSGAFYPVRTAEAVPDGDNGRFSPVAEQLLYNGATFDRQRGNVEGNALASAARTSFVSSPTITNYNHCGILVNVIVTVAGTLQLTPAIRLPSNYIVMSTSPYITGVGQWQIYFYPGVGINTGGSAYWLNGVLPRSFVITIGHGDSSSWTYSVDYTLIV